MGRSRCGWPECDRARASKLGLCQFHLYRFENGIPLGAPLSQGATLIKRKRADRVLKSCTYKAAHARCRREWGSPSQYPCAHCGGAAREWGYDGTDPDELCGPDHNGAPGRVYSQFPEFYMPLCRLCHTKLDKVWRRKLQNDFKEFLQWKRRELVS